MIKPHSPTHQWAVSVLVVAFAATTASAQFDGPATWPTSGTGSAYDAARTAMLARTEADRKAAAGNADVKVWDFVVADRKAKRVTVHASATNIRRDDPIEFFLNTVASGKDYESLAVTFAKPADVQAALDFIGVQPGRPIDPRQNRFWSRGPRMIVDFQFADAATPPVRAESLVVVPDTGRPLPMQGVVYTGSTSYAGANGVEHRVAADSDAGPIASVYNEPASLFDMPVQAPQSAVYGRRKPAPAFTAKPGELVDVRFAVPPIFDDVADAELAIAINVDRNGRLNYGFGVSRYAKTTENEKSQDADSLPDLLARLSSTIDGKADFFTKVLVGPDVRVTDVRNLYAVLRAIEKDRSVKLDAPPPGELFQTAFFPDPAWRDRTTRLGEPWELFLTRDPFGLIDARLERQTDDPAATPRTRVTTTRPANPKAMAAYVTANESKWSKTLFVYPPADLTYGELMKWTKPVGTLLPRVFVFAPEDAGAAPTTGASEPGR